MTVYVPMVLKDKLIVPVDALIDKPEGAEEKEPPGMPVIVGVGLFPDVQ